MIGSEEKKLPPTLADMRRIARTATDGSEKEVLSLYDGIMARTVAPPIAWAAIRMGFSADFVTLLSVLSGLAGAALFTCGTLYGDLAAVGLLHVSYLLDCIDGDVARATGTAGIDGHLRDTYRHYLLGPLMFCALTLSAHDRHPEKWIILAGVLAAFFSTRLVGDIQDRVTLEGLIKKLQKPGASPAITLEKPAPSMISRFVYFLRGLFLRDLSLMNWFTLGVIVDAVLLRPRNSGWLAIDCLFIFLAAMQVLMKTAGLIVLWRRGVGGRVDEIANEIEARRSGRSR